MRIAALRQPDPSLLRRQESILIWIAGHINLSMHQTDLFCFTLTWIPAFAGMTLMQPVL